MNTALTPSDRVAEYLSRGQMAEARVACSEILRSQPNNIPVLAMAAAVELQMGQPDAAADWLARAVKLAPRHAPLRVNLGEALRRAGRLDVSLTHLREAVSLQRDLAEAHYNLALACMEAGRGDEGLDAFKAALVLKPEIDVEGNYERSLWQLREFEGLVAHYRDAIERNPASPDGHMQLGAAYQASNQPDQAVVCFERALELAPDHVEVSMQLGHALAASGRLDDALATMDRIIETTKVDAVSVRAASQRLFWLSYLPSHSAEDLLREALAWRRRYVDPLERRVNANGNRAGKEVGRPLRVGYLSAHFCEHVSAFFIEPLLKNHDHTQFQVVCYSDVTKTDAVTDQIRPWANVWRDVHGVPDRDVAELIQRDEIDILIDLSMHMAGGRPMLLAQRAAPVQMCWLAYPGTTGLSEVDYRLSDRFLDPPSSDLRVYSEKTLHLRDSFWCYDPHYPGIEVSPLPADENGFVTFGSLNSFVKVSPEVLALWARVLGRVPHSRLLLQCPPGRPRAAVLEAMAVGGIDETRIEWVNTLPREQYFRQYHQIDIGLDSFPYGGHTTSLDAFWMGVPVVTLPGRTVTSRGGVSLAMNLGLPELIANSADDYVEKCARLASDRVALANLRSGLRAQIERSPLMDAPRFARSIETLYCQAWAAYASGPNS